MKTLWVLSLSLLSLTAQADSLRCGQNLVREGDSQDKVLSLCGEPLSRAVISEVSQTRHTAYGRETQTIPIEKWTYKQGSGQYLRELFFEAGSLQRIQGRQ